MSEGGIVGALARQIRAGGCALSAWVGINDPAVAEQLARDGYDTVTLDMQHGAIDLAGAMRGVGAAALAGKPAIVRIPVGEFQTASRVIDAASLWVRRPWNTGWRMRPSLVHSVNATSATRLGLTQWPFTPRGAVSKGGFELPSAARFCFNERNPSSSKPVPTLPA